MLLTKQWQKSLNPYCGGRQCIKTPTNSSRNVWGVDFMGPFVSSCGNLYILVAVNYVTKWIEAIPSPTNDHKVALNLLKKIIFPRFGVPRVLISDGGSHFAKKQFEALLKRYGVHHKVGLPYHPQTQGQVEVSNREIKNLLERMVNKSRRISFSNLMTHYGLLGRRTRLQSA